MADYKQSILRVLKTEGGYVNDKNDSGGETFKGIARNFWHDWAGWKIVDQAKKQPGFPRSLYANAQLTDLVVLFYKTNFWDKIGGNNIKNQDIAHMLVDSAVNEGVKPAVKRAQKIVGLTPTGIVDALLISKLNTL